MNSANTTRVFVDSYLAYRRQMGYQLTIEGQQLYRFARFADTIGHRGPLTRALAVAWATAPTATRTPSSLTAARRIEVLIGFAHYHQQFEPDTEVPPRHLFGRAHRRLLPHIFNDAEIVDLMKACGTLHPAGGRRGAACRAIFGLLAATGLRISEAIALEQRDVDLNAGVLEVRNAKFGKTRWVPLHPTVTQQLSCYASENDAMRQSATHERFFIGDYERPLTARSVRYAFTLLRKQLGWKARGDHAYPRIHDLRHGFICRTIQRWYDEGVDVDSRMLSLSTYVGHVHVTDTYWYVTATPELMAQAAQRFTSLHTEESES